MSELIQFSIQTKSKGFFSGIISILKKTSLHFRTNLIKEMAKDKNKNFTTSLNQLNRKKNLLRADIIILFLIIFISMFSQIYTSEKFKLRKLDVDNYITIKIEASGPHTIINGNYVGRISSIKINENMAGDTSNEQNLVSNSNTIIITFNTQLTSCNHMFVDSKNISVVDLTHLDFTAVTDLEAFFEECGSLKSVDLSNIVILMHQKLYQ